jgi:hypothetical protein
MVGGRRRRGAGALGSMTTYKYSAMSAMPLLLLSFISISISTLTLSLTTLIPVVHAAVSENNTNRPNIKGCRIKPKKKKIQGNGQFQNKRPVATRQGTDSATAVTGRKFQLDLDDFDFRKCLVHSEPKAAADIRNDNGNDKTDNGASAVKQHEHTRAAIEVQFMPDEDSIPFVMQIDPENSSALSGTRLVDNRRSKNNSYDGRNDEIGEINIVFGADSLMAG